MRDGFVSYLRPRKLMQAPLVNQPFFMVEEGLCHHGYIQEAQRSGIPVPFLPRGDPFFGDRCPKAFIILPDAIVRTFMVILLKIIGPVMVQLFQCFDPVDLYFPQERIHHLVEFFLLSFGLPAAHRGMAHRDAKLFQ